MIEAARTRVLLLAAACAAATIWSPAVRADEPAAGKAPAGDAAASAGDAVSRLARVTTLRGEAVRAIAVGQFDRARDLVRQAAAVGGDSVVARMAGWLDEQARRQSGGDQVRQAQYEKNVANFNKLRDAGFDNYAFDAAADAYVYSADKAEFVKQDWVRQTIEKASRQAADAEAKRDWLNARRIYTDLSAIEPVNPKWRKEINDVSRRLSLLAIYAPDVLTASFNADSEQRKKVAELLEPTKGAATKPADEAALNDDFKVDWHQMLSGVKLSMLVEALEDARESYYRTTSYAELLAGGLDGLTLLATTDGLDKTFPKLGDAALRAKFADGVDALKKKLAAPDSPRDRRAVITTLGGLLELNRTTVELPEEVVIYEFTAGATNVLDPFTSVIWPYEFAEFQKSTQGEFTGVGVQISEGDDGYLKVVSPLPDTPAYKAGIHADDAIVKINGKNAKGVKITQAVKAITGPRGSSVTLTVRSPDGSEKDVELKRDTIHVASVKGWSQKPGGSWDWMIDPDSGIGYIRLTNFTKESSDEVRRAIDGVKAAGGRAIVFDLRANPGGLLNAATEIADRFLSKGNIVSTRTSQDVPTAPPVNAKDQRDDVDLPMAVLVNQYSASASEIVSGALKDHGRATIVGERTYGKGSVQVLYALENREAYLKLTTSHYYLPSGRCLHREEDSTEWGVEPDVKVEMTPEQMRQTNKMRQDLDVLRDDSQKVANPTTLPAEFKSREEQLLASDPQLSAAVLVLRMQLANGETTNVGREGVARADAATR